MINCREPFALRGRVVTASGCPTRVKNRRVCKNNGTSDVLEKVCELNQQELIQSFKDECDVALLVKRYENGDASALARLQGVYMDTTGIPRDPTDAHNLVRKAHEIFDNLDESVKARFNNSFETFISTFGISTDVAKAEKVEAPKEVISDGE